VVRVGAKGGTAEAKLASSALRDGVISGGRTPRGVYNQSASGKRLLDFRQVDVVMGLGQSHFYFSFLIVSIGSNGL
jgi:hypothetical protein